MFEIFTSDTLAAASAQCSGKELRFELFKCQCGVFREPSVNLRLPPLYWSGSKDLNTLEKCFDTPLPRHSLITDIGN